MVCGLTLGYLDKERVDFPGTVRVFPMLPLLVGVAVRHFTAGLALVVSWSRTDFRVDYCWFFSFF